MPIKSSFYRLRNRDVQSIIKSKRDASPKRVEKLQISLHEDCTPVLLKSKQNAVLLKPKNEQNDIVRKLLSIAETLGFVYDAFNDCYERCDPINGYAHFDLVTESKQGAILRYSTINDRPRNRVPVWTIIYGIVTYTPREGEPIAYETIEEAGAAFICNYLSY